MTMTGCGKKIGELLCCTVINGDCEDYLHLLSGIDLVITDPPYGMNYVSHRRTTINALTGKILHDAIVNDDRLPVETIQKLIKLPRLASYFFCRWQNLWQHETLPAPNSVITWVKNNHGSGDLKHTHAPQTELALFYPGSEHAFKTRPSDVIDGRKTGNVLHATQKPVELIKQMLAWYDFDMVLDPYAGSGTTCRAAKELGKHFLGFEIDETYWRTACEFITSLAGNIGRDSDLPDDSKPARTITEKEMLLLKQNEIDRTRLAEEQRLKDEIDRTRLAEEQRLKDEAERQADFDFSS